MIRMILKINRTLQVLSPVDREIMSRVGEGQFQIPSPSTLPQMEVLCGPWGTPIISSHGTCWGILEHFGHL